MASGGHTAHDPFARDPGARGARVIEPEVLPPEDEGRGPGNDAGSERQDRSGAGGTLGGLGFLLAGVLLDAMDVMTAGPVGLATGIFVGGSLAFLVAGLMGLSGRKRLLMTAAAAIYCSLPMTELIPMGTLLGTFFGIRQSLRPDTPPASDPPR